MGTSRVRASGSPGGGATKNAAAYKACLVKKPLQPTESDPAKNPHYLDDFRTYVRRRNDGGLKVKSLADGSGWNYDSRSTPTRAQQDRLDRDCELRAYQQ
ncbi:hypothetical protein [Streptomyces sp. NPDC101455]|uniref:hypothetical protein n=1 Tax=Streptomyces sp. NPDC101455 TaxID=3366142 RepID=UPI00381316CB